MLAVLNHWLGLRPSEGAASGFVPEAMSGEQPPNTPWQPFARRV